MIYVLDSSAIIAWLTDENGADAVDKILRDIDVSCYAHNINLCEVYYDALRRSGTENAADAAIEDLLKMDVIARDDFDGDFWKQVGKLKSQHRASLADLCAVVLAKKIMATIITSDHHEFDALHAAQICPIQFIR